MRCASHDFSTAGYGYMSYDTDIFSSIILLSETLESKQRKQWDFSLGSSMYDYVLVLVIGRSAIWL